MFWTVLAWVLAPIGLLACFFLLSGSDRLERWGSAVCGACITFGSLSFRLDRVCVLLAIFTFIAESVKLSGGNGADAVTVEMRDRQMMTRLRHERNFWISLYMLSLWLVAGRVAYLVELRRKGRPKWE